MAVYHRRPRWALPEREATPEGLYWNRRAVVRALGLGAIGAVAACGDGGSTGAREVGGPVAEDAGIADLFPAEVNAAFVEAGRPVTSEEITSTYNNFYEFGSHKRIYRAAQDLRPYPWAVTIDGEVEAETTIDAADLSRRMGVEERIYRHRCVEAWSMVIPWTGFPLAKLVAFARPTSRAKYLKMETFFDPDVASGQRQSWYPWPYVEGLTIEEATNDLAFIVTGVYGKPAAPQFGAPLRLSVPWKYGFKSIKSIVRFTFTETMPMSFWQKTGPTEYGFWANVNPNFDHARWSQATERPLSGDGERIPTQLFNGYAAEVAGLYPDLQDRRYFY